MLLSERYLCLVGVVFLLLLRCRFSCGDASDINCLKSIKASLEDPLDMLSSTWDFSNNTEGFICNFLGIECWHPHESKILNIKLADLGLKGQFPRGVENCTSLTGLDLSNNNLNGSIPDDVAKLIPYISSVDLSSNRFSGEIPKNLANCNSLNVLKLDNNKFSGQIPQELGQLIRIKTFSITNNQLSGQVPIFTPTNTIGLDSYANNHGLCGFPLESCPKKSMSLVRVIQSNGVVMLAAAGFGVGFVFSFSYFHFSVTFLDRLI